MLEPFTALNVAANIVQFIELGIKIFAKSNELYKSASGRLPEHRELESASQSLEILVLYGANSPFTTGPDQCSPAEKQLIRLTSDCEKLSNRLKEILEPLRLENKEEGLREEGFARRFARRRLAQIQIAQEIECTPYRSAEYEEVWRD